MKGNIWRWPGIAWLPTKAFGDLGQRLTKLHARFIAESAGRRYSGWLTSQQLIEEMAMRLAFAASALCLGALGLGLLALADQPVTPQPPARASTAPASVAATVAGDDAARHVKRTACLKEAKARKLIGADRTAFLKSCIDAPAQPSSASRHSLPDRP
jgi:hypothetical protein